MNSTSTFAASGLWIATAAGTVGEAVVKALSAGEEARLDEEEATAAEVPVEAANDVSLIDTPEDWDTLNDPRSASFSFQPKFSEGWLVAEADSSFGP